MSREKADSALRTIGELSEETGIAAHVLRYWERQIPALQPLRRAGGRRYYRAGDVTLIRQIDELVNRQGFTLEGAARALRARRPVMLDAGDGTAVTIDQLVALRSKLQRALEVA